MADQLSNLLAAVNAKETAQKKPTAKPRKKDATIQSTRDKLQGSLFNASSGKAGTQSVASVVPVPAASTCGTTYAQPLPFRVRAVMTALQEATACSPFTPAELQTTCSHDINTDLELYAALSSHERVHILDSGSIRYRPYHDHITSRQDLLTHVREHPGTLIEQLDHSYKGVRADIDELIAEQRLYIFRHPVGPQEKDKSFGASLYPRDRMDVSVSDRVTSLFLSTPVPSSSIDLRSALVLAHLPSALVVSAGAKRELTLDKKSRRKKARAVRVNLEKATNKHLPSLFMGAQPTNIDSR
ncbi:MAG: hypothetical protein WDW38_000516 [Sanguina aurantia]